MNPMFCLIIGGMFFSLSGLAVAFSTMGTSSVGFYRMIFGGLALVLVAIYKKKSFWAGWKPVIYASLAGIFLALDLYMWHKSIRTVGPGLGSILTNCQAFALSIFAIFLFKERPTWIYFISLVLAILGIGMIVQKDWIISENYQAGVWLGLASAVAYAICVVFLKFSQKLPNKLDALTNMVYLSVAAALFLLATAMIDGESLIIPDTKNLISLLIYGLMVQGLAWLMVSYAMPYISASIAGLILLLEPVITYLVDILFLSAKFEIIAVIGCFVTLIAIYLGSQYGSKKEIEI
jgi:drug/metabolite transporter (DMT)-like permease